MTVPGSPTGGPRRASALDGGLRRAGSTHEDPAEGHLVWEGDLDIASAPVLAAALGVLVDLGVRRVALDVSGVAFLDCAGLSALLEADTRLQDGLGLVGAPTPVTRLLALTGLSDRFSLSAAVEPTTSITGTRATIEQSKGLVMGSFGCTADQASKMLLSTALRQNVQVQVLASLLVAVTSADLGPLDGGAARAVQRVMGLSVATA